MNPNLFSEKNLLVFFFRLENVLSEERAVLPSHISQLIRSILLHYQSDTLSEFVPVLQWCASRKNLSLMKTATRAAIEIGIQREAFGHERTHCQGQHCIASR